MGSNSTELMFTNQFITILLALFRGKTCQYNIILHTQFCYKYGYDAYLTLLNAF
jgi:hypothetical protein